MLPLYELLRAPPTSEHRCFEKIFDFLLITSYYRVKRLLSEYVPILVVLQLFNIVIGDLLGSPLSYRCRFGSTYLSFFRYSPHTDVRRDTQIILILWQCIDRKRNDEIKMCFGQFLFDIHDVAQTTHCELDWCFSRLLFFSPWGRFFSLQT